MINDWTDSALRDHALREHAARAMAPSTCVRRAKPPIVVPTLACSLVAAIGLFLVVSACYG